MISWGLVVVIRAGEGRQLEQYVNDRPYAASSFLSVALAQVFRSALRGESAARPELGRAGLPLEATLAVVPSRGGDALLRRLFEPLGYAVDATPHALDTTRSGARARTTRSRCAPRRASPTC